MICKTLLLSGFEWLRSLDDFFSSELPAAVITVDDIFLESSGNNDDNDNDDDDAEQTMILWKNLKI